MKVLMWVGVWKGDFLGFTKNSEQRGRIEPKLSQKWDSSSMKRIVFDLPKFDLIFESYDNFGLAKK